METPSPSPAVVRELRPERLPPGLLKPIPSNFHPRTYGYNDRRNLDHGDMIVRSDYGSTPEGESEFRRLFSGRINRVLRHA